MPAKSQAERRPPVVEQTERRGPRSGFEAERRRARGVDLGQNGVVPRRGFGAERRRARGVLAAWIWGRTASCSRRGFGAERLVLAASDVRLCSVRGREGRGLLQKGYVMCLPRVAAEGSKNAIFQGLLFS